ncbi:MAG: LTA synthase family protein [Oscillospiraceae bacterium]|nr:LTA synthase family protein [Oscillospiraceae bacterium]
MGTEIKKEKTKIDKRKRAGIITAGFLMLLACVVFFTTIWFLINYDDIRLDQILYQMKAPADGTPSYYTGRAVSHVGSWSILLAAALLLGYMCASGRIKKIAARFSPYRKYTEGKVCAFFREHYIRISAWLLVAALLFFCVELKVGSYLVTTSTPSDFIEENYVKPEQSILKFPAQKRNLIYIFLESMENTYAQDPDGDGVANDYIKELAQLADANVNFSESQGLGGALNYDGTTWTASALVSQTSGLPVKVPLLSGNFGGEDVPYMPGIISIGSVLQEQGYKNVFLMGSDAGFGGRRHYITEHGGYEIGDTKAMIAAGKLPEGYAQWWGYEDAKLFMFAKETLTELASKDQPFNLTMLTADTHFPDGYVCEHCEQKYDNQYANVLSCSSAMVYEFVNWIQQQDFYENTTIVISGDHLTMDPEFLESLDEEYTRTIYNCIINSAVEPKQEKNRQFGVFDMFPTTLAAMGVEIEGDRLALGTDLFSGEKTLTEIHGQETLNRELQKNSRFYNEEILQVNRDK